MGESTWMYVDSTTGTTKGPLDKEVIKRLVYRGYISEKTYVWKDGMKEWKILINVDEWKDYVQDLNLLWYYYEAEVQHGPIPTKELVKLLVEGEIDGLTKIWTKSMIGWDELGNVSTLKPFIQEANEIHERQEEIFNQPVPEEDQVYDASEETKTLVAEDGTQYIYDSERRQWTTPEEKIRDDLEAIKAMHDEEEFDKKTNKTKDKNGVPPPVPLNITETSNDSKLKKKKKRKKKNNWKERKEKTWVYVNGLPLDITEEEIGNHFAKCGVIQTDIYTGKPRIKLYQNKQCGGLNGDASICYMKSPSVQLAVDILDKVEIRPGWPLDVQEALFSQKGETFVQKKPRMDKKAKLKLMEQKMALSWSEGGEGESGLRIVAITNMFEPKDFIDENFGKELEEDILEECSKFGEIEKITVFEKNNFGPVVIKFKEKPGACKCVDVMNGRYFGGRKLLCGFWDGTDFTYKETKEENQQRVEDFGKWLEEGSSEEEEEEEEEEEDVSTSEGHQGRVIPDSPISSGNSDNDG